MSTINDLTPSKFIDLHVRKNLSLTKIGDIYGVSRQRVHQIKKDIEKKHGKINRRVLIDPLTLKHYLDQGWTATQIAENFNMSNSKVSRIIRNYRSQYEMGKTHIELKRKTASDILPKQELFTLYLDELYTDKEIAHQYQLSPSTVNNLRKTYKIPTIQTKKLRKLPLSLTIEKFTYLLYEQHMTIEELAKMYDCNVSSILRLKKTYGLKE